MAADYEMPCGFPGYEIEFLSPNRRTSTYKLVVIPFSPDEWPYVLIWNGNNHDYQPGCLPKKPHLRVVDLNVFCQMSIARNPAPVRDGRGLDPYRFNHGWFHACVHVMQRYLDPTRRAIHVGNNICEK
jgi:hypothetical protein